MPATLNLPGEPVEVATEEDLTRLRSELQQAFGDDRARLSAVEDSLRLHLENETAHHEHTTPLPEPVPPVGPPDPPQRVSAPVRTLRGESGFTISDKEITRDTPGYCLTLVDCADFSIDNVATLGGGIFLRNCRNWTVRDGLQQQTLDGHPGWSDNELGLRIDGCDEGRVSGNVGAYFDGIYQVRRSRDITFNGNFTYNPRGPRWRGQHIQAWELEGTRNERINILDHYALSDYLRPGKWPVFWQEDAISLGHVDGGRISNVLTEMRQLPDGSGSHSGSGQMFEGACSDIDVDHFTTIGQANVGFGVSSRSQVRMRNVLSHYVPTMLAAGGHVAGFITGGSTVEFGENVRLYGAKPRTADNPLGLYGAFYTNTGDGSSYTGSPTFGDSRSPEAAAELAAVVPPIAIPDVGFVLP